MKKKINSIKAKCLSGGVKIKITGELRSVINFHCESCIFLLPICESPAVPYQFTTCERPPCPYPETTCAGTKAPIPQTTYAIK